MIKLIDLIKVLLQIIVLEKDSWVQIFDNKTLGCYLEDPNGAILLDGKNTYLSRRDVFRKEVVAIEVHDNGDMDIFIR